MADEGFGALTPLSRSDSNFYIQGGAMVSDEDAAFVL
jgi:hypothetical protein